MAAGALARTAAAASAGFGLASRQQRTASPPARPRKLRRGRRPGVSYHVFIERAQDPSSVPAVAAAIAARYRLPADAIGQRMAAGRFRVKANVDLDTAKAFARDLEGLGAVCTVVDAGAPSASSQRSAATKMITGAPHQPPAIPAGPVRPRTPAAAAPRSSSSLPAASLSSLSAASPSGRDPSAVSSAGPAKYESGLSAAFGAVPGRRSSQELGALDTGTFKLASLDGADEDAGVFADDAQHTPPPDDSAFAPPDAEQEILQLETDPGPSDGVGGAASPPADAFAPPASDNEQLQIVTPSSAPRSSSSGQRPAMPPPASEQMQAIGLTFDDAMPSTDAARGGGGVATSSPRFVELVRDRFVAQPRVRIAAGVVLCIVLAWIPARVYWGVKVDNAQAQLDVAMQEPVTLAKTDEAAWIELREIGQAQKALAQSRLVNTKITAVLMWIGIGGVLGWVYFKKVPWDDL